MKYKLLIVDDEAANLRLLERLFRDDFHCLTASSGEAAIELLNQHDVAILITDQRMPHMSGIELLKRTAKLRPHMARILLTGYTDVESLVEAINCGLVDLYITKPWNNDDLKLKVNRALEQYEQNRKHNALQVANERLQTRLKEMKLGIANALEALLRDKDEYYFLHASRVATLATKLAESLGVSDEDREDLAIAAALHHLGHVSTPDEVLRNMGSSSSDERSYYDAHSERGARILTIVPELRNVADLVRFHRENFDGAGSPRGLEGDQIPLACRIIRVADEYDLLTQPRSEPTRINHDEAMRFLGERAGTEFDPRVVKAMWQLSPGDIEPNDLDAAPDQVGMANAWRSDAADDLNLDLDLDPLKSPLLQTAGSARDLPTEWVTKLEI
jgi:response regulator RpfG family c-di-GMP phosphodiesterase